MNTTDLVHFLSADTPPRQATARPALAPSRHELAAPVRNSILHGRTKLVGAQRVDGSWAASMGGDAASFALLVLLDAFLEHEPSGVAELAVKAILRDQQSEGGWSLTRGAPFDLDKSVLAYFALKLAGESACRPELARARHAIRAGGGADRCSATARLWFALLGQIEFETCLPIVPELLMMPGCTENFTAAESCLLAARAVIWALRPKREIALSHGIRELFVEPPQIWRAPDSADMRLPFPSFASFWKGYERVGWLPLRRRALERADFLLTEATINSAPDEVRCDELVWRRIALEALGHDRSSRVVAACQRLLDRFAGDEPDDSRSRPQTSLTSDTALAIEALRASGVGVDDDPIAAAIDWLMLHRLNTAHPTRHPTEVAALVRVCGCMHDSEESNSYALPPDIKLARTRRRAKQRHGRQPASELERFTDFLLGKAISWQQPDGGWTLGNHGDGNPRMHGILHASARRSRLASDAASTGMMLELVARLPRTGNRTPITRGAAFLRSTQHGDGSWWSADDTPSITATAWAIRGLVAAGAEPSEKVVAAGINWLLVQQQFLGGWSESAERPKSDDRSTESEIAITETVSAVLALVTAGLADEDATRRGIEVLVDCDAANERDLHAIAWKLIALARWNVAIARLTDRDESVPLRLVCGDST